MPSGPRTERGRELHAKYGIQTTTDNAAAVSTADVVVLSVKPQRLSEVMKGLKGIRSDALVLSVIAGANINVIIDSWWGKDDVTDKGARQLLDLAARQKAVLEKVLANAPESASGAIQSAIDNSQKGLNQAIESISKTPGGPATPQTGKPTTLPKN